MLDAKVHFGHQTQKWCPKMAPFIFMERNGYHVIDLRKTLVKVDEAAQAMRQIARSGRRILFVATKKQAKDVVATKVKEVGMPFVTERWPGGMLTNFPTIRKAVKKMSSIDKMMTDGTYENMSKRERLQLTRVRAKLEKNLGSIADMNKLPAALFVVDVQREYIAVREANRLGIPVFAMVDTCCDPTPIDYVIPSNDDVNTSIELIVGEMCEAIKEGIMERKMDRNAAEQEPENEAEEDEKKVIPSDEEDEEE